MNNEQLLKHIEDQFTTSFPNGWFSGGVNDSYITFQLGIISDHSQLTSGIIHNDPVHHQVIIHLNSDGTMEAKTLIAGICVNPPEGSYLAMSIVKTGYRKTTGDAAKVLKSFVRFFPRLKVHVAENEDNIYQRSKYDDKFFK